MKAAPHRTFWSCILVFRIRPVGSQVAFSSSRPFSGLDGATIAQYIGRSSYALPSVRKPNERISETTSTFGRNFAGSR